jgi:hypothetical protein
MKRARFIARKYTPSWQSFKLEQIQINCEGTTGLLHRFMEISQRKLLFKKGVYALQDKVQAKLPLHFIYYCFMKTHGETTVQLHTFSTSALSENR